MSLGHWIVAWEKMAMNVWKQIWKELKIGEICLNDVEFEKKFCFLENRYSLKILYFQMQPTTQKYNLGRKCAL